MKKILSVLILSVLLLSSASAETIRQQVGAPEHLTLEPFHTATGISSFVIDAVVEVPDVENVKIYEYISQYVPEKTVLAFANAIGINITKVSFDEKYTFAEGEIISFHYDKNSHSLAVNNTIYAGKYPEGYMQYRKLNNKVGYDVVRNENMLSVIGDCAEDTSYPFEAAKALACEVVAAFSPEQQLGLAGVAQGFQNLTAAQIEKLNNPNYKGTKPKAFVYGGYMFLFHQLVDGIPIIITSEYGNDTEFNYSSPAERLCMVVSEGQVVSLRLDAMGKVGEVKQESCELLDFAVVLDIAQKILPLKHASKENIPSGTPQTTTSIDYTIDRITFGYMRVLVQGHPNTFELIPVWDFFGNELYRGVFEGKRLLESYSNRMDQSYLTINAMNGAVIDRAYGY